jgi:AbrB family looped-hinge helix DNA binding protein
MKATGIVRRIDDLGRVVIPKEIRRTLRIREGDPHYITLTVEEKFFSCITEVHWKASCCKLLSGF